MQNPIRQRQGYCFLPFTAFQSFSSGYSGSGRSSCKSACSAQELLKNLVDRFITPGVNTGPEVHKYLCSASVVKSMPGGFDTGLIFKLKKKED